MLTGDRVLVSGYVEDVTALTMVEAARLLNVSERTVNRWLKSGKLKGRMIAPNRWAIQIDDVQDAMSTPALLERVQALENEVKSLRSDVQSLKSGFKLATQPYRHTVARSEAQEAALLYVDVQSPYRVPSSASVGHYSSDTSGGDGTSSGDARYRLRHEVAKMLEEHGVTYDTARRWVDLPLVKSEALRYARRHYESMPTYRAGRSELHTCQNPHCACQVILV